MLPTVAGCLVGGLTAAEVQLRVVAEGLFGIGVLCWLLLGSLVLNRLFFARALPPPLVPTLAIELAPPAVAGLAWFAINGGTIDLGARVLGGYAVLMALVQLRLLPVYRRLRFSPGFWAFTFSSAAAVSDALTWLRVSATGGRTALAIVLLVSSPAWSGSSRSGRSSWRGAASCCLLPRRPPRPRRRRDGLPAADQSAAAVPPSSV